MIKRALRRHSLLNVGDFGQRTSHLQLLMMLIVPIIR